MARISTNDLIHLLRRLGIATKSGVDMRKIWEREAQQGASDHRRHMGSVHDKVSRGQSLAGAMAACDGFFPPLVCDLIDIGEQTGTLEVVLPQLVQHYEHLRSLRRLFLQGITWPLLKLLAALFIVGLLIWILGIIGEMPGGEQVDILGLGLVGNQGLLIYLAFLMTVGVAGVAVAGGIKNGVFGNRPMQLAMATPVLGKLLRVFALARFSWTLSLAQGAGADARRSLALALKSTHNAYFTDHADQVDEAILESGVEMHEALRKTGVFPEDFLHSLETAELAGATSEALDKIASDYKIRAENNSKGLTIVSTFAVGGFVVVLIVALIFRLFFFYLGILYDAANM